MKKINKYGVLFSFLGISAALSLVLSCKDIVGLGDKLDLAGPVVNFTTPNPRQLVPEAFPLEGTMTDNTGLDRLLITIRYNKELANGEFGNANLPRQWRYASGRWQISDNNGASWHDIEAGVVNDAEGAVRPLSAWEGNDRKASWKLWIDLNMGGGVDVDDGDYQISMQAWNTSGFSDDNSVKTRTVIFDNDPPKVTIISPLLYRKTVQGEQEELEALKAVTERRDPALMEKLLNENVFLQWQIEDRHDIDRVEIEFYLEYDDFSTDPLPKDPLYTFPIDVSGQPPDLTKPNGNFTVPDLTAALIDRYTSDGETQDGATAKARGKNVLKAVAVAYDKAGHNSYNDIVQEKLMGFFMYWPDADTPWVSFPAGLNSTYPVNGIDEMYTIYPGRLIKSNSFDDDGVDRVLYSIYPVDSNPPHTIGRDPLDENYPKDENYRKLYFDKFVSNPKRWDGTKTTTFPWDFLPPGTTGEYYLVARTIDYKGVDLKDGDLTLEDAGDKEKALERKIREAVKAISGANDFEKDLKTALVKNAEDKTVAVISEAFTGYVKVQDISFPDFPVPPEPNFNQPLYTAPGVRDGKITLKGTVTDDSGLAYDIVNINGEDVEVPYISIVWINPESPNYAAMSQLAYFRDPNYEGWKVAKSLVFSELQPVSSPETVYNTDSPNRVWKVPVVKRGALDSETGRTVYDYELTIDLNTEMNINVDDIVSKRPLSSQVFLLKATDNSGTPDNTNLENNFKDSKSTIITYAPQGDAMAPSVSITEVKIERKEGDDWKGSGGNSGGVNSGIYKPGVYAEAPRFIDGDKITITGTWREDSVRDNGDSDTADSRYMKLESLISEITINGQVLNPGADYNDTSNSSQSGIKFEITDKLTEGNTVYTSGTFTAWAITGNASSSNWVKTEKLYDALVFNAMLTDVGGNIVEDGCSFLIQSEVLKLLRISSDHADGLNKDGEKIEIFIEFNKRVKLKNPNSVPKLILNSKIGAKAVYDDITQGSGYLATKHFFIYEVNSGDSTLGLNPPYLNVIYLDGDDTTYALDTYPFAWVTEDGLEDMRLYHTNKPVNPPSHLMAAKLPTQEHKDIMTSEETLEYLSTLAAGKNIQIDTQRPVINSITTTTRDGNYRAGSQIYITLTFNEPVKQGSVSPALTLNAVNGSNDALAGNPVFGSETVTFRYDVEDGYNTEGWSHLMINGIPGTSSGVNQTITDLAGNPLSVVTGSFPRSIVKSTGGGSNIVIDTTDPRPPTLTVTGNGTDLTSVTPNLYYNALGLKIAADSASANTTHEIQYLEYSVNNGIDWIRGTPNPDTGNLTHTLNLPGSYTFIARQIDVAGNVSQSSAPVTVFWDKGDFITRISSAAPNGTYTNNDAKGPQSIPIDVYFRKPVKVTGSPFIILNSEDESDFKTVEADLSQSAGNAEDGYTSLRFTYGIGENDNTPLPSMPSYSDEWLDVTGISPGSEENAKFTDAEGVDVTHLVNLNQVLSTLKRLKDLKKFRVVTGPLLITDGPDFTNDAVNGGHTLTFTFNRDIYRGTQKVDGKDNTITIIQAPGTTEDTLYRIPAVLTETQYARFRNLEDFDIYYEKGTNGIRESSSQIVTDTATKYVLKAAYNTRQYNSTTNTGGVGGRAFAEAFREAEEIKLPINASMVSVAGNTLTIHLRGSNALQVEGAEYEIYTNEGFVQDILGNPSPAIDETHEVSTIGFLISKPFIRVSSSQETIGRQTVTGTDPEFYTVTQPYTARVQIDSRTPGSTIEWRAIDAITNVPDTNYANASSLQPTVVSAPAYNQPATGRARNSTTANQYSVTIPYTSTEQNVYQGYQFRIRAWARKEDTPFNQNEFTENMAWRSVVTYNINTYGSLGTLGQSLQNGDQVWIRGGNNLTTSDIPGYPLTWEDNFEGLQGTSQRAGIRLMTKDSQTTTNYAGDTGRSIWKWLTWGVTTRTYIHFYLGRSGEYDGGFPTGVIAETGEPDEKANRVWKYGPYIFSSQRAGWTNKKPNFPLYPGGHTWLRMNSDPNDNDIPSFVTNMINRPWNLTPPESQE
ncbi:MAG: Ig-like domain-containing protein [Treponema sp.]|jgi:hypothetical protein|nr:Ig-like domain-containing protein [Treponema sp.]